MTKYISLFGATTTDTQVQVVKENQVIIGIGAGASRKRYVVYKVEHTARGYGCILSKFYIKPQRRASY